MRCGEDRDVKEKTLEGDAKVIVQIDGRRLWRASQKKATGQEKRTLPAGVEYTTKDVWIWMDQKVVDVSMIG